MADSVSTRLVYGDGQAWPATAELGTPGRGTTLLAILGLIAGVVLAIIWRPDMPIWLQPYLPIMIVAALDALVGAARAGLEHTFSDKVFAVSFISNVAIAALIVWIGDLIGVGSQLSTAVLVVLGIRIFTNAAVIRRKVLHA